MRREKNNLGLSLVELIVAFAIFSIVGAAVCGFVSFCAKNYTSSNKTSKLQYDQQLTVNKIRDMVLETTQGVSAGENYLYIVTGKNSSVVASPNPSATPSKNMNSIIKIALVEDPSTGKKNLMMGQSLLSEGLKGQKVEDVAAAVALTETLSDSVTTFKCSVEKDSNDIINQVNMIITFAVGEKTVTVSPAITLRNKIVDLSGSVKIEDVYVEEELIPYSKIAGITIYRDGVAFGKSKTDTVKLGSTDSSTSVVYEAKVIPKASYKGAYDDSVTWSIDESSIKTDYLDGKKYNSWVSISDTGVLTVKANKVNGKDVQPSDVISGNYLVISVKSNEDPSITTSLRIKIASGGVYPVKIETEEPYGGTPAINATNATATYLFKHKITYTDSSVKTGDDVYKLISYKKVECTDGSSIPAGAGFSSKDGVDGKFVVVKSMEGKTYRITVAVAQKSQSGEEISQTFELTIPRDLIPDTSKFPVPKLSCLKTADRGANNSYSASWNGGAPSYEGYVTDTHSVVRKTQIKYYYWFEWEVNDDDNVCGNWYDSSAGRDYGNPPAKSINYNNVFFDIISIDKGTKIDALSSATKTTVYTESLKTVLNVNCKSKLDWSKNYTYKVSLRVKVSKTNDYSTAKYYIPGGDGEDFDLITTDDRALAYVDSVVVTIPKVELKLTAVPDNFSGIKVNNSDVSGIVNNSDTIGLGKVGANQSSDTAYYYKVFTPKFTGISVTKSNYNSNIMSTTEWYGDWWSNQFYKVLLKNYFDSETYSIKYWKKENGNEAPVQLHYASNGATYKNADKGFFYQLFLNNGVDYQVYVLLKLRPLEWQANSADELPYEVKFKCRLYDSYGNYVDATFADGSEYKIYKLVNRFE